MVAPQSDKFVVVYTAGFLPPGHMIMRWSIHAYAVYPAAYLLPDVKEIKV